MSGYAVAHLDEIEEMNDGRCPYRPVRHHFGITAFGITAWTARDAGDRIINEHDEAEPDLNEELYLVPPTCGTRSRCQTPFESWQRTIRTSIRSATSPRSRNWSAASC
jgi:hypothetical protein